MFKNHPKGLIVAALANLGERFGFYTMMAILVFFLQARYGMTVAESGSVYSWFYFGIYALALLGGFLADNFTGLGRTILAGIITMLLGYLILSVPGMSLTITYIALFVIALGNGLFKGNLQALIGNLYEKPQYSAQRDSAFSIFYMFINVGAFFAPTAAEAMLNKLLQGSGFIYNGAVPAMCNAFKAGDPQLDITKFQALANSVSHQPVTDLTSFANSYITAVSTGYNYAFGIAAMAMLISMTIFIVWKRFLKDGDYNSKTAVAQGVTMQEISPKESKERITALLMVFVVVIFFWMSFHQNGLTLSQFAKDYTTPSVDKFTNLFFNIGSFLGVIFAIVGVVLGIRKNAEGKRNPFGWLISAAGLAVVWYFYRNFSDSNPITPAKFQQFNPIFIVAMTPVVVGFFGWLASKGKEPSTPRKIGYGMIIAAFSFALMMLGSFHLTAPKELVAMGTEYASPYLLIGTYFSLTIAELCLSPMGISFVSKVAPPKYKALMQGGWLGATAIGNKLLFVGSSLWEKLELWQIWLVFIVCCMISASIIFAMMKFLEKVTKAA
ncbi:MAG: peptide MFS transporter [Bacteroidales bacterium]